MESGKIEFAPDYKSEKRQPLNSRVKISACGRPYLDRKEAVRRMLDHAPDSPPEDIAALARIEQNEADAAERSRLEREVVEKAKAYGRAARATEGHMKTTYATLDDSAEGWRLLRDLESTWEEFLLDSVYALLDFEAKQEK